MRMNIRDALTSAIGVTGTPHLDIGYDRDGVVNRYEQTVTERALEALGMPPKEARKLASRATGCARVRLAWCCKKANIED